MIRPQFVTFDPQNQTPLYQHLLRFLWVLLLFSGTLLQGQSVRKYSNEFMNLGVDAAALGMGQAVTASTDDVNAGYWNPAGLLYLENSQVSAMHASYFANIAQYDYIAYATPVDERTSWGASLMRFGVDDILNTTQLIDSQGNVDYNRVSKFSTADYALTLSLARKTEVKEFRYGVNAKIIRRIIGKFATSWGFGFDVGCQWERKEWKFGLMLRDVTTTYNVWNINEEEFKTVQNAIPDQNQELPEKTEITLPKIQMGVSRYHEFDREYSLKVAFNVNGQFYRTNDWLSSQHFSATPAIGAEFAYTEMVFARAGLGNFQNVMQPDGSTSLGMQPNLGLGFYYRGFKLDYAITNIGDATNALYSNIFSLRVDLNAFD